MNTVIYGQPLISNVNKETSEMKNETEQCDKCGITLCDSCSINVGGGVYCLTDWPTTGYWKTHSEFVCGICDLLMSECVKTDSNCENAECEDEQTMKNETRKNETKPACDCPTNAEVVE